MLYRVLLAMNRFELTTLEVKGTDCIEVVINPTTIRSRRPPMPIRKACLQNVYLEAVNRRRIDNTMIKDKNVKRKQ